MTTPPPSPVRDPSRPARMEVVKSKLVKRMRLMGLGDGMRCCLRNLAIYGANWPRA